MSVKEKTAELHDMGFNCAQCVLCCCREITGLEDSTALAVSGGFGGGLRSGEICGAVSGGVMALGMARPFNKPGDMAAKAEVGAVTKRFVDTFREKYGAVTCRELLGQPEDRSRCGECIAYCAELAETMVKEK